jgi:hypothetical protein
MMARPALPPALALVQRTVRALIIMTREAVSITTDQ